jgi:hypothetical protein
MAQFFNIGWVSWVLKLFQQFIPIIEWFDVTFSEALNTDDGINWQGFCLVQRIEAVRLSLSGTEQVRLTLRAASSSSASIERIYISRPDPAGDPYDSATDLTAIISTPLVIPANTAVTLPAVNYNLDEAQPLLIAVDFSVASTSRIRCTKAVPFQEAFAYFKLGAEAAKANRTGFAPYPGIYLIEKIEISGLSFKRLP